MMIVALIILACVFINEANYDNIKSNIGNSQNGTIDSDIKTSNNQAISNRGNVNNNNDIALTEKTETMNYGSFIIFGSIVIVIIVGITVLLLWNKRKNKKCNIEVEKIDHIQSSNVCTKQMRTTPNLKSSK